MIEHDSEVWLKKQLGISLPSDDTALHEAKQDAEQKTQKITVVK